MVTLLKLASGGTCLCSIIGAGAFAVVAQMVSTFPVKNVLKVVYGVDDGC